ncbi:MAG: zf-TFIIB domain-containing protein [Planctomycetota bacterium]
MQCPNCRKMLRTVDYEGIQVETCRSCGGEWLDSDELGHVVRAREERFGVDERRAIAESTTIKGVVLKDVDRDLACPKCGSTTDPVNYGGNTGLIVDRCTSCRGFWLDAAELEKVQMLVEGWDDQLPDDLAKFGPRLREIEKKWDQADNVSVSRFSFVNAMINGILDFMD